MSDDGYDVYGPISSMPPTVKDTRPSFVKPVVLTSLDDIPFIPAEFHGGPRPFMPRQICLHTGELLEVNSGAEALAGYFKRPRSAKGDPVYVSSTFNVDVDSITSSVRLDHVAYTAGPGNRFAYQIEIVGTALQTGDQWDDDYSRCTLERLAALCALLCAKFDIPTRKVGPQDLIADPRVPGFSGHKDWSDACIIARKERLMYDPWYDPTRVYRGKKSNWITTNHQDPGRHFPWARLLEVVDAYMV